MILGTVEIIDSVTDQVISLSLESYIEARLKELQDLQSQLILNNQELTRLVAIQKESVSPDSTRIKITFKLDNGFFVNTIKTTAGTYKRARKISQFTLYRKSNYK